ncbi:hypothetical protein AAMO2058_000424900 [Amorphochlora amoebiformis]
MDGDSSDVETCKALSRILKRISPSSNVPSLTTSRFHTILKIHTLSAFPSEEAKSRDSKSESRDSRDFTRESLDSTHLEILVRFLETYGRDREIGVGKEKTILEDILKNFLESIGTATKEQSWKRLEVLVRGLAVIAASKNLGPNHCSSILHCVTSDTLAIPSLLKSAQMNPRLYRICKLVFDTLLPPLLSPPPPSPPPFSKIFAIIKNGYILGISRDLLETKGDENTGVSSKNPGIRGRGVGHPHGAVGEREQKGLRKGHMFSPFSSRSLIPLTYLTSIDLSLPAPRSLLEIPRDLPEISRDSQEIAGNLSRDPSGFSEISGRFVRILGHEKGGKPGVGVENKVRHLPRGVPELQKAALQTLRTISKFSPKTITRYWKYLMPQSPSTLLFTNSFPSKTQPKNHPKPSEKFQDFKSFGSLGLPDPKPKPKKVFGSMFVPVLMTLDVGVRTSAVETLEALIHLAPFGTWTGPLKNLLPRETLHPMLWSIPAFNAGIPGLKSNPNPSKSPTISESRRIPGFTKKSDPDANSRSRGVSNEGPSMNVLKLIPGETRDSESLRISRSAPPLSRRISEQLAAVHFGMLLSISGESLKDPKSPLLAGILKAIVTLGQVTPYHRIVQPTKRSLASLRSRKSRDSSESIGIPGPLPVLIAAVLRTALVLVRTGSGGARKGPFWALSALLSKNDPCPAVLRYLQSTGKTLGANPAPEQKLAQVSLSPPHSFLSTLTGIPGFSDLRSRDILLEILGVLWRISRYYRPALSLQWRREEKHDMKSGDYCGLSTLLSSSLSSQDHDIVIYALKTIEEWSKAPLSSLRIPKPGISSEPRDTREPQDHVGSDDREISGRFFALEGALQLVSRRLGDTFRAAEKIERTSATRQSICSAVLGVLANIPETIWGNLSHGIQKDFIRMANMSFESRIPPIRTAACRFIGVIFTYSKVPEIFPTLFIEGLTLVIESLSEQKEPVLSVRIRACWAIANLCDPDLQESLTNLQESPKISGKYPNKLRESSMPWKTSENPMTKLLPPSYFSRVFRLLLQAAKGNPKLHPNAIRALGNLCHTLQISQPRHLEKSQDTRPLAVSGASLRLSGISRNVESAKPRDSSYIASRESLEVSREGKLNHKGESRESEGESRKSEGESRKSEGESRGLIGFWLQVCETLEQRLNTGTEGKAQSKTTWNASYAIGNLLSNPWLPITLRDSRRAGELVQRIIYRLLSFIPQTDQSSNYKIRIQAVGAISRIPSLKHFGAIEVYVKALTTIINAVQVYNPTNETSFIKVQYQGQLRAKLFCGLCHLSTLCVNTSDREERNRIAQVLTPAVTTRLIKSLQSELDGLSAAKLPKDWDPNSAQLMAEFRLSAAWAIPLFRRAIKALKDFKTT